MQKLDGSKVAAFASGAAELHLLQLHCGWLCCSDSQGQELPGCLWGKKGQETESGKVVKCAGGSFLTKHVKRPSSRTCPDGGEVKGRKQLRSE